MGNIGDGIFQILITLLTAAAVVLKQQEFPIDAVSQFSHMPVAAGNIDQGVGI